MVTQATIQAKSDQIGAHFRVFAVAGFGSAAGNGSGAITGASAAKDVPLYCLSLGGTGAGHTVIGPGSLSFVSNRLKVTNTNTTNKKLVLFWWDEVA